MNYFKHNKLYNMKSKILKMKKNQQFNLSSKSNYC